MDAGFDFVIFVVYVVIALLFVPTAKEAADELKDGTYGGPPLPALYAEFLAALSVAFWPVMLAAGMYMKLRDGE